MKVESKYDNGQEEISDFLVSCFYCFIGYPFNNLFEMIASNKEISAVPSCEKHPENCVKYIVQAPAKSYLYLSYLLEN